MQNSYEFNVKTPDFVKLGYIIAIANVDDKHDPSAPTNFHWKILKCRMIIFSNSSILASPDKNDCKQVHIIFNKFGDDYDKITSLFMKFSLRQINGIRETTPDVFQMCFTYTMTAKLAPLWNILGQSYLIHNRDFLTTNFPQDGVLYNVSSNEIATTLELKPIKINIIRSDDDYVPGEWVRVLPSLFKATIDDIYDKLPDSGSFKRYKDLRRHWKNIHGYRLPEEEVSSYCAVQFWRGEPLTYPKLCVLRHFPIITPIPKPAETIVLTKFVSCLKSKMSHFLGKPLTIQQVNSTNENSGLQHTRNAAITDTQAVSLCTPTQLHRTNF
ncbi:uncharacterized protein C18orf63-like [Hyposmocoma kahamanoa]|uniref:uncharacterized protein C18orf63-like n=1 Tax=Hyposmocoma kahamanoa TaxID=1477025 RepID=UPI000E6D60EE|nr:uncharacterized protein C18orf63-like [Hyposmocoma kahamanoa]